MNKIIEVKDLTKKFKNFLAVDKISFEVEKGEIFGFLGPNGAGKTTTIKMLTTLLRPTKGLAKIAGNDVLKQQGRVREHIGLVAEKIILYDHLTARENLKFFGQLHGLSMTEINNRTKNWIGRLRMEDWLDEQVGSFSTGMKQRINIVRALLTEPDILFLDEPTLGLDPQTTNMIREFVTELNDQGITIILTTHDMIESEVLSNRVAIIDHGKIAAIDTIENLKKQSKVGKDATLEDVFLAITGKNIRDIATGRVNSSAGHGPGKRKQNNRVR